MYDPVQEAEETAKIVCRGEWRKSRRFRPAWFYGGLATADCVGCRLRCIFCWSWHELARAEAIGEFYTPEQVAVRLIAIARKNNFDRVRISGSIRYHGRRSPPLLHVPASPGLPRE
jgi:uncharacterized Fe-S cluster-containing radical SAM superfamily protein